MLLATSSYIVWNWAPHVVTAAFIFAFGACVGSFMNVVIFRLPAGISIISPPSRCPTCGARLTWRENFPILGWLVLRGKCRWCRVGISPQYMIVEVLTAVLFAAIYLAYFLPTRDMPWWNEIGGPWWSLMGPGRASPALILTLFMIAGLVAMTAIDARTFTIPLPVPLWVTICAVAGWTIQGFIPPSYRALEHWPIQTVEWRGFATACGGVLGIAISYALLRTGRLRYSFSDYAQFASTSAVPPPLNTDTASAFELFYAIPVIAGLLTLGFFGWVWAVAVFAASVLSLVILSRRFRPGSIRDEADPTGVLAPDYPHARREMLVELLYLAPCILGLALGWFLGPALPHEAAPPWVHGLGGSMMGYLVGGGLVWGIRILGTLAFGREAMGQGDIHMLAAIGAVLGWEDVLWIFFLAAFVAFGWMLVSSLAIRMVGGLRRELPFGPHLALATLLLMFARPAFNDLRHVLLPGVSPPPSVQQRTTRRSFPAAPRDSLSTATQNADSHPLCAAGRTGQPI